MSEVPLYTSGALSVPICPALLCETRPARPDRCVLRDVGCMSFEAAEPRAMTASVDDTEACHVPRFRDRAS